MSESDIVVWRCQMNQEKYKDPTAERAVAETDKWERQQRKLEEQHGIKRGDHITIIENRYVGGNGRIIQKKIKARVKALYPYLVELQLSNGQTRSPTYWELERIRARGGANGNKEYAGTIPGDKTGN